MRNKTLTGACLSMNQFKFLGVNRRALFSAIAFSALTGPLAILAGSSALAQEADGAREPQAEWRQSYETAERLSVNRETTPILSQATLAATDAAIQQYQGIVSRGGWSLVPAGAQLKIGHDFTPGVFQSRFRDGDLLLRLLYGRCLLDHRVYHPGRIYLGWRGEVGIQAGDFAGGAAGKRGQ